MRGGGGRYAGRFHGAQRKLRYNNHGRHDAQTGRLFAAVHHPALGLSARVEEYDRLFGFEVGVDDYVTKPFSPKEVMARISAVLKRSKPAKTSSIVSEGLEIDMAGRNVYVDGEKVNMTPKEYELLFYLVENKGIAISREQLLSNVWGYDFYGDDRTVDTHIKMLRSSLGKYRDKIVTLRGLGYKIEL